MERITIALMGTGPLVELLAGKISNRADLKLVTTTSKDSSLPEGTDVVIHLPDIEALNSGAACAQVSALLRAGINVVSTAPIDALNKAELIAAAREGSATFHGSGSFQSRLISRFNRAFASITRNISKVELLEELQIGDHPVYPWASVNDTGLTDTDPQAVNDKTHAVESLYDAGLHTLAEAVFADKKTDEPISVSAHLTHPESVPARTRRPAAADTLRVHRALGDNVTYDSVWTQERNSTVPLRYQLTTTSSDAIGNVTITFEQEGDVHPTDHLTASGLLDAVRPVHESAPGILHHDLDIYNVKVDDRLAR